MMTPEDINRLRRENEITLEEVCREMGDERVNIWIDTYIRREREKETPVYKIMTNMHNYIINRYKEL